MERQILGVHMRSSALLLLLVPLFGACASAGGAPAAPVSWQPGRYILEATVTNQEGVTSKRNEYRAELVIGADGAMTMTSPSGACKDNSGQDGAPGQKRFQCGEESYRLRPGVGTVTGEIEVQIAVEAIVTECVPQNNVDNRCAGTPDKSVKSTKQVRAPLRVRAGQ